MLNDRVRVIKVSIPPSNNMAVISTASEQQLLGNWPAEDALKYHTYILNEYRVHRASGHTCTRR